MKNFNLISIATAFIFLFSSCSSNDEFISQEDATNSLKSYTIKRDTNGAYSLGYELSGNAIAQNNFDVETDINEIHIYGADTQSTSKSMQHDLTLENNKINISFIDANTEQKPQITILDTNTEMARNTSEEQLIDAYSLQGNEDGTYDLAFHVKENVEVNFVFNEAERVYEIHLIQGNGVVANFERTFTKEQEEALHIAFVNHFIADSGARNDADASVKKIKRPELIIN
jgi:hypothetical protein